MCIHYSKQHHTISAFVEENEDSAVNTNSDASSYFDELGQESNIAHLQKKKKLSPKKKPKCALRMDAPKMDPPVLQAVNRLETLAQAIRQDEFDTFGVHVASQLRSLPLRNAIVCQNFINNYLSQERLKILNTQHFSIARPTSSLSEYTRYTSTPEAEANTSRNQAFRNQRETSTSEASGRHLEYEEDYF
ncbi:unnamed protein product [Euphydryas editha]|uniref:Uncharacterized protein n=1 Tax=Euphydryas editha TaxID=104508 RepID=A0AAU9UCY4_EUPED|nr:unnamed protein product [Euphydryas editha]